MSIKRGNLIKKKAISPLIATVLLIGFTVIIAVAIWMWYGNVVKEQMEKQGALNQIKTDCTTQIVLTVLSASRSGSPATDAVLEIKNEGTATFNGVRILVQTENGQSFIEKEAFNPGEQKSLTFKGILPVEKTQLDVIPMIVRQGVPGTCADKKVSVNL